MDLDDFKVVNDSLGHAAGDPLLTVVAQRLERCLRSEDTLARFGGDEFVVLLESVEDPGDAVRVAQRITEGLRSRFALEGRELYVSASVGISFGTVRTKSPENLLRCAVEQREVVLDYQPIFDFGSQQAWGSEALIRWDHPKRGLLGPDEFVAVAEEAGLIIPIGSWVLEEACRRTKEW